MNLKHIILGLLLIVIGCVPETTQILTDVKVDINDPIVKDILRYEILQQRDSLAVYASHEDPTYRYLVAKAFSSFRTDTALPILDSLMKDPVHDVKAMASYALGQIGSVNSQKVLVEAFISRDTLSVDNLSNSKILESMGKLGDAKMLEALSTISTYRETDTLLLLGQVRGLYRFALRGMNNPKGTETIIKYLNDSAYPNEVRLMCAHYLARSKNLNIDQYKFQILQALSKEQDPLIKMALAQCLTKIQDPEVQTSLMDQLELEQDYRVKVNLLKAIGNQEYIIGAERMMKLLDHKDLTIAQLAADFFISNGNKDDAYFYKDMAKQNRHYSIKAKLYESVLASVPYHYSKTINANRWELLNEIKKASDPFEKAAYIRVLGRDPLSYGDVHKLLEGEENKAVTTAIYESLADISSSPNFEKSFKGGTSYAKAKIWEYFQKGLSSGDVGAIAAIGNSLAGENSRILSEIDSAQVLDDAKSSLTLPRDIEGYNAMEKALAKIKGVKDPVLTVPDCTKIPDYELLKQFKDSSLVVVKTNKGVFTIELYPDQSPSSIINFLELVESKYYNDKKIHRVVPNFVVQVGCNRGDGYGSLDYTIRSEVGPYYYNDEGYVGLASAGPHTESSQWFITHSPTPHLDGNYTIIGKVINGMDIVHTLQIGDSISDIIIKNI